MNCKPGDLAVVIKSSHDINIGKICHVLKYAGLDKDGENWVVEFAQSVPAIRGSKRVFARRLWAPDTWLRPLRNQPGNEDFVVKARKTVPRAKPVTGPVTINERGEPA